VRRLAAGVSIICLAAVVVVTGASTETTESGAHADARSNISALPHWLHKTIRASAYVPPTAPLVPILPVGTSVPANGVSPIVSDGSEVRFGLTFLTIGPGQTYPALSTDDGMTWHVAGPLFHVNAAQAALVVGSTGSIPPVGAYFWGQGGNIISLTYDEGAHWSMLGFANSVDRVSANRGNLKPLCWATSLRTAGFSSSST
jgi:hypothetical protein